MHLWDLAPVRRVLRFAGIALFAAVVAAPAFAQALDAPTIQYTGGGYYRIDLDIQAGPSGTPNGFVIQWMRKDDWEGYGWPADEYDLSYSAICDFTGEPTLNVDPRSSTFRLAPNGVINIQMGDLFDETGVDGTYLDAVMPGDYVFRVWAAGDGVNPNSGSLPSTEYFASTSGTSECTQGFWKNHGAGACHSGNNADTWPASCTPMTLGNVVYTKSQLCSIYNTSVQGNGLVSMAHQLITVKLNICNGSNPTNIAATVAAADAQIGNLVIPPIGSGSLSTSSTSSKTTAMDNWNNGTPTGVVNCTGVTNSKKSTWGAVKAVYR